MNHINYALAFIAAGTLLTFGSMPVSAQENYSGVKNRDVVKTELSKSFTKQVKTSGNSVDKLAQKVTEYTWDINTNDFVEQKHTNYSYDVNGNNITLERIYNTGDRIYTIFEYNEDGNIIKETRHSFNKDGFNPVNPYKPELRFTYTYDDIVKDFVICVERESRYKDGWTSDLMFPYRYEITLKRDEQQRVTQNYIIGDDDKGRPYSEYFNIEYNEDGTVNVKKYVNEYGEDVYSDSTFNAKMYSSTNQFVANSHNLPATAFIGVNAKYGVLPETYEQINKKGFSRYLYTYDENGIHNSTSIINVNDGMEYNSGVTLSYMPDGDKIVENNIMGTDLNKDGMITIGNDYIISVNKREFYKDEQGNEYYSITYKAKIDHVGGITNPTSEDEITYTGNKEVYTEFTYDEDGFVTEVVTKHKNSQDKNYVYDTKTVYSDFFTIVPNKIKNVEERRCSIGYAEGVLSFCAVMNYEIFDMEGRMVTAGTAKNVNVDGLASGMYLVKAGNEAMKFVK